MLKQIRRFAEICAETLPMAEPIYEFGSYQVPGQEGTANLRELFPDKVFVGTDMRAGPGVDEVIDLHDLALPDESVGSAFLLETLEHVEYPRKALANLQKVLAPGGIVVISTPMNLPIHNYPHDYWRFTPKGMESLLQDFDYSYVDAIGPELHPTSVLAVAAKAPLAEAALTEFRRRLTNQQKFWRALITHLQDVQPDGAANHEL